MGEAADFCWVGADGALHSGTERDLMQAFLAGQLPAEHPVWRQGWSEWIPLFDALSQRRIEQGSVESEPAPTEPRPPHFEELSSQSLLPVSEPTWIEPLPIDPDATGEDLTLPRGHAAQRPSAVPFPLTVRSLVPETDAPPPPAIFAVHPVAFSEPPAALTQTLPPSPRPSLLGPLLVAAGVALVGITATATLFALSREPGVERARVGVALRQVPQVSEGAPTTFACRKLAARQRIVERVGLSSSLSAAPRADSVAIGGVSTERSGFALTLALDSLSVREQSVVTDPVHLGGVVPLARGAETSFVADRFASTLPGATGFRVGMTPSGFSRIADDGAQETLWPGGAAEVISRPSAASAPGAGIAIAFRRGNDDRASVRFCWLDEQGRTKSELGLLEVASGIVGPPSVANNGHDALIAYAVRQPAEAAWGIELGTSAVGKLPTQTLRLGAADGARDQRAPAVAALADGRWLVAWVEGDRQTGRELRARILDASLRPNGPPLVLAKTASSVESLLLVGAGERLALLYTERASRSWNELGAVAIECR
jgi:hypothetical protein